MAPIILYSKFKSARLQYVVDFIFNRQMNLEVEICTDKDVFIQSNQFKINYTNELKPSCELHIVPHGLLQELDCKPQQIEMSTWHHWPTFFTSSDLEIPFDIFSASFYLLSRYEEYLNFKPDLFHRFPEKLSIAFQQNFLKIPLIDYWVLELKKIIQQKNPLITIPNKKMSWIPTYDIDIAYSYLGKGFLRNLGGMFLNLSKGQFKLIKKRISVLRGREKDPYDCYDYLEQLHSKYKLDPIYFFLLSRGGLFDKNISPTHPLMKSLIQQVKSHSLLGIHPSYQSNDHPEILNEEMQLIDTEKSRQHYIRFALPQTFRNLIKHGIYEDYSMGYGSINGFRASTSFPHYWFDVEKNETTSLQLFPFCFMECNSFFEQKYSIQQTKSELAHYRNCVHEVGGTLITIWHNFALGTEPLWNGWKDLYESFVKDITVHNLQREE